MTQHPMEIDQLIHARWVIPIIPENTIYEHFAVALNDEKIIAILPSATANTRYHARKVFNLDNHILLPGLINAHGHAAMALFRGYADDLPLMEWLEGYIWPAEGKWVSETFVKDGTELAIAEMILNGTTSFSDMYFFPNIAAASAIASGIRSQFSSPILQFPSPWANNAAEYLQKAMDVYQQFKSNQLTQIILGPHAPYTVEDDTFTKVVELSREHDLCIQLHLHETAYEVMESEKIHSARPIERLHKLGVLSEKTQCVHMTQINDRDIEILQASAAHVVHCPKSNLKLASGFCPVDRLQKSNINVCLGTDGASSNNNVDIFNELNVAALLGKGVAMDAAALDAHSVLRMATINGAKALNQADRLGTLEQGKLADMIAVDVDHIESQPLYDAASHLVYLGNGTRVSHSWVNGKLLLENRQLQTLSYVEILEKAKWWGEKIRGG